MENQKIVKLYPQSYLATKDEIENKFFRMGYASNKVLTYKPAPDKVVEITGVYIQRYGKDLYLAWRG